MDTNAEGRSRAYATGPAETLNYFFSRRRGTGPIFRQNYFFYDQNESNEGFLTKLRWIYRLFPCFHPKTAILRQFSQ